MWIGRDHQWGRVYHDGDCPHVSDLARAGGHCRATSCARGGTVRDFNP